MEKEQVEHITKNLVELIKLTDCNDLVVTRLLSNGILGQIEVEELGRDNLTRFAKSKRMYEIIVTRVGGFERLKQVLEETNQSGALKLLKQHGSLFRRCDTITYDKNHVLGRGSLGTVVYKGTYDRREVAVKVLKCGVEDLDEAMREVETLKQLDGHQNIVRYFMAESTEDLFYIALELCVISLQDEVTLELLKLNKAEVLKQCAAGLAHLHKNKFVHGDLKPANILVNKFCVIKLSDFGISRQIQTDQTSVTFADTGTLDWMAPEVLQSFRKKLNNASPVRIKMSTSSDVFSLGCVFHFVLTNGLHPFGENIERPNNILRHQFKIRENIVGTVKTVLNKMLSATPQERPSAVSVLKIVSKQETQITSSPSETHEFKIARSDCNKSNSVATAVSFNVSQIVKMFENSPLEKPKVTQEQVRRSNGSIEQRQIEKSQIAVSKTTILTDKIIASPQNVDGNEYNNLVLSVRSNSSLENVKHLVENGVDWRARTNEGKNILHVAAECGNLKAIDYFTNLEVDIQERNNYGCTPLLCSTSATKNFTDTVSVLIENGSNINDVDDDGDNLIFLAALRGKVRSELEHLVKLGIPWKTTNKNGRSVLHHAAEGGNLDAISYFISLGAEVHEKDNSGETPLLRSTLAEQNFTDTVSVLIENGSNINDVDDCGNNLILLAAFWGKERSELEHLVKLGVTWKTTNKPDHGVLHLAANGGNLDAINYFISLGAE